MVEFESEHDYCLLVNDEWSSEINNTLADCDCANVRMQCGWLRGAAELNGRDFYRSDWLSVCLFWRDADMTECCLILFLAATWT